MAEFKFKMGDIVADIYSGFTGCIVGIGENITGVNRYNVIASSKTKYPDSSYMDENNLKLVKKSALKTTVAPNWKYNITDEVESKITGFHGIITMRLICSSGCLMYYVESKYDKKFDISPTTWINEIEIKCLKKKAINIQNKETGGFNSRTH